MTALGNGDDPIASKTSVWASRMRITNPTGEHRRFDADDWLSANKVADPAFLAESRPKVMSTCVTLETAGGSRRSLPTLFIWPMLLGLGFQIGLRPSGVRGGGWRR
ncbi:hypothetical protein N7457_005700 [Penicillium paradoxum]|uniref:uncharacterized protein n=1 Tax=Penicillium paradoxum TaxID=176176 RepID=UPI0025481A78|nr:uncharacterized protein N7457_005700 [Penicillium paradoxum]KAJ5780540.1 hypothetical protein N7457_005700 [Penicillium paradoxum]